MKIELDRTVIKKEEIEVTLPYYIQNGNEYYCFFDDNNLKRSIYITDYSICKGIDYNFDYKKLNEVIGSKYAEEITKEVFQNKLMEILSIINGAIDEMHKADEQQKDN